MTVQDDERERELVRLFNLDWDPAHQRAGVDAMLRVQHRGIEKVLEVEVKSTTKDSVSTARDVGMEHITKRRRKLFVIGYYSRDARRPELLRCRCLTPVDMSPWIDNIEDKIAIDYQLASRIGANMDMADLYAVCGRKDRYDVADARRVLKQQWRVEQYAAKADLSGDGRSFLSEAAMLDVLRTRAGYIARRGATLNNPHITKTHLIKFAGSDREVRVDWASRIRAIASDGLDSQA